MRRTFVAAAAILAAAAVPAHAQFGGPQTGFVVENPVLRRMWSLGMDSSQVQAYAQVLFDSLGPRLVGAPGMDAAENWMVQMYQRLGITARKERYGTWRGWRRGIAHVDLVAPRVRVLEATMLAFSPGTANRPVRAPVVALPDLPDSAAYANWMNTQARGKFVLISFPQPNCRPDTSWAEHDTRAIYDSMRSRRQAAQQAWMARVTRTGFAGGLSGANLSKRLDSAGVAGVLTNTWTGGWGTDRIFSTLNTRAPSFDVSCEDYSLLYRLASNNQGPVIEVTADAQAMGEIPVFNVIGTIPGTIDSEYVVLSAHFDSWDGGSGATDNGTGTITMLEAMRILKAAYPHPRRTIIVGHWNAEEMGLIGSRSFAADHPEVVRGMQALFNQDNGTGRIVGMSASGLVGASGQLAGWLAQLPVDFTRDIKYGFTGSPGGGGTDHASFVCYGAPAFGLGSEPYDYFTYTWHTTRDTYDKLSFDDLKMNATTTAMLVYLASEDSTRVSRERRTVFPRMGTGAPGSWPTCPEPQRTSVGAGR